MKRIEVRTQAEFDACVEKTMNISTTSFDYNYHNAQKAGSSTHGRYVLHNIDVYNVINVNGIELQAVYQCGVSYNYNDYDCPNPNLALSEDGGTSKVLTKINRLYESDFEDKELIIETLEEVKELCSVIDSVEKLKGVYDALNDNKPTLSDFLDPAEYTNNFDDYIEDESGLLTLKS